MFILSLDKLQVRMATSTRHAKMAAVVWTIMRDVCVVDVGALLTTSLWMAFVVRK